MNHWIDKGISVSRDGRYVTSVEGFFSLNDLVSCRRVLDTEEHTCQFPARFVIGAEEDDVEASV
jgi:hypothetical protein